MEEFKSKKIENKNSEPRSRFRLWFFLFFLTAVFCLYIYLAFLKEDSSVVEDNKIYQKEYIYFDKLTGQGVDTQEEENPQIIIAMIDNHLDARPQSGMSEAKVVYEVPVEGNITRYMIVFEEGQNVDLVGPIRSARPYYLDFANEYGEVLYLHVGGSPEALKELKTAKHFDINQFYWGNSFWRDWDKEAPHNVYTSSTKWQEIIENKNYQNEEEWQGWNFDENLNTTNPNGSLWDTEKIKQINIAYSNYYEVSWRFNEFTNRFDYFHNGELYEDVNENNLSVENVLIQYVQTEILDSYGRLDIKTVGSGEARVLRAGEMIRGTWEKEDKNSRTRFFNEEENEISLVSGKTWVQVVSTMNKVEVVN